MKTILVAFDEFGDEISVIEIPIEIDLSTITHYQSYTYAVHAEDWEEGCEFAAQIHAIDVRNGERRTQKVHP